MYYSYVEIEYVATSFSPTRMDLVLKLLSAGTAIDEIFKSLGGNQLKMVVVDEVSMLSAQFLVLLDTRL